MTLICWLFGHRFHHKLGNLMTEFIRYQPTNFCTRCGKLREGA